MRRRLSIGLGIIAFAAVLQACGVKPAPQESCNFVQNSEQQRVSWGAQVPVVFLISSYVPPEYRNSFDPSEYYEAIRIAANVWNEAIGREVLRIGGVTDQLPNHGRDQVNLISFDFDWNGSRIEQARTTINWVGSRIYEADIHINVRDFKFFGGDNPRENEIDMVSLMIHEFGHALGLKHIEEAQSVMQPTLASASRYLPQNAFRRELGEVDLRSIRCEY